MIAHGRLVEIPLLPKKNFPYGQPLDICWTVNKTSLNCEDQLQHITKFEFMEVSLLESKRPEEVA